MENFISRLKAGSEESDKRIALLKSGMKLKDIASELEISIGALSLWYRSRGLSPLDYRVASTPEPKQQKVIYNYVGNMPMHERLKVRHFMSMLHRAHDQMKKEDKPDVLNFMETYQKLYGVKRNTYFHD